MLLNPVVSVFKFRLKNALPVYLICSAKIDRHTHDKNWQPIGPQDEGQYDMLSRKTNGKLCKSLSDQ